MALGYAIRDAKHVPQSLACILTGLCPIHDVTAVCVSVKAAYGTIAEYDTSGHWTSVKRIRYEEV